MTDTELAQQFNVLLKQKDYKQAIEFVKKFASVEYKRKILNALKTAIIKEHNTGNIKDDDFYSFSEQFCKMGQLSVALELLAKIPNHPKKNVLEQIIKDIQDKRKKTTSTTEVAQVQSSFDSESSTKNSEVMPNSPVGSVGEPINISQPEAETTSQNSATGDMGKISPPLQSFSPPRPIPVPDDVPPLPLSENNNPVDALVKRKNRKEKVTKVASFFNWLIQFVSSILGIIGFVLQFIIANPPIATAATIAVGAVIGVTVAGVIVTNNANEPTINTSQEFIGTIEKSEEVYKHTIVVNAGNHYFFQPLNGTKDQLTWRLTDPNKVEIFNDAYKPRHLILDTTGNYTLELKPVGEFVGQYAFKAWALKYDQTTIAINESISSDKGNDLGDIELPGDQDIYLINVKAGQKLFIEPQNGSGAVYGYDGLVWKFYDPDGIQLFENNFTKATLTAKKEGDYRLQIYASGLFTSKYGFTIWEVLDDVYDKMTVGTTISSSTAENIGHIEQPSDQDVYIFSVTIGQELDFQTINGQGWFSVNYDGLIWKLYDPDGSLLVDNNYKSFSITAEKEGLYKLVVNGSNFFTEKYSFSIKEK
jgi:hypothetical protein